MDRKYHREKQRNEEVRNQYKNKGANEIRMQQKEK